jgi:hypothetical protein
MIRVFEARPSIQPDGMQSGIHRFRPIPPWLKKNIFSSFCS